MSFSDYALDDNATVSQKTVRILHEKFPSWWNNLSDSKRLAILSDRINRMEAAFEAGVLETLKLLEEKDHDDRYKD